MIEILVSNSRWLYTGLVLVVGLERLIELGISWRNQQWLRARGAVEVGVEQYPRMVLVHALFLFSCPAEVWILGRPFIPVLAAPMLVLLAAATALRHWTIATLGRRWTTRVLCLPGEPLVTRGPFRFLRHPNYLAVATEIAALPLLHGAWWTATAFSAANALVLRARIRVEDEALRRFAATPGPTGWTAAKHVEGRWRTK
jgi:methyltransferase